jgi:hypothetical protein
MDTGIIQIAPISFSSSIKSIQVYLGGTALTGLISTFGIYGINRNGSITAINASLFSSPAAATTPDSWVELLPFTQTNKTIYEQLCDTSAYKLPIAAFEPYKDDRYGMLALDVGTKATAGTDPVIFKIEYVEGSPSESPLTDLAINPKATPIV